MAELVAELADMAAQARQDPSVRAPVVTAYLAQGASVHGELADAVSGPGGWHLCLARAVDRGTRDLAFFPASAITALIVHDVGRLLAPPADAPEPPSRLALLRAVADARAKLVAATGRAIEIQLPNVDADDAGTRAALGEALPGVLDVLTAIARDDLGRTALATKVAAVHIRAGDHASMALDHETLVITVARLRRQRQTPDALRAALEKLL